MEDRNPLPMMVESAGETPTNRSSVDDALVTDTDDEPEVTETSLDAMSEPRFELEEVGKPTAWLSIDLENAVDLQEAQ
jgi:hypothetical protein